MTFRELAVGDRFRLKADDDPSIFAKTAKTRYARCYENRVSIASSPLKADTPVYLASDDE